jgi:glycosyltransferase involved in cell wall biosynthesis
VAVIHNGVDWEMFVGATANHAWKQSGAFAGKFVVGYVGNIGLAQGLETLLEAAEHLRGEPVAFLLMGEGVDKARLAALARARGLDAIHFLESRPRHEVPSVLATCDALLVILRQDPLFEITIPSKIYEYMAAGKPVLCSVGGEAATLVVESKCGLPVRPSDGRALAEGVRALMSDPGRCRAFGMAGATRVQAHFSRSSLMETYAHLLERLAKASLRQAQGGPSTSLGAVSPSVRFPDPDGVHRTPEIGVDGTNREQSRTAPRTSPQTTPLWLERRMPGDPL